MSLTIEQWKDGLEEWTKVKKNAQINIEQATLYIDSISKKIKTLEKRVEKK